MSPKTEVKPAKNGTKGLVAPILAAGALVWREKKGRLEVLVVHRPRYDDWSIPKGKLDPGETFPSAAVREVAEETGYRVRLHRPLPASIYTLPDGRSKVVHYWVGTVRSRIGPGPKNRREIDEARWVPLDDADSVLTRGMDHLQVDALRRQAATGTLRTEPIIIQRHAAALSRSKWRKGEGTRPLSSKGKKQAAALPPLIGAFAPMSVVTSPWKRCEATVEPFAREGGMEIETKDSLTEAAHEKRPSRAAAVVDRVLRSARPAVVCTHRPVLPTVIDVAREHATRDAALELPTADPYLAAGEALVLHTTQDGRVVAVERHQPDIG
ncbi:NUDIX hydrolase [Brachybacterium huguangmaarense]|uniref:NUDIX hydrolase n=1 Tax=Brachybacterium huguangmaarense TaxID=1652028 RepID=A0ABY6G4F8_9MICO|nr:NUDIX hydrolase [Brachybacterium huguangmaarense]UYG18002.1 NUDIX hydrolase [Brachybacterium huguangmaarense]